MNASLAADLNRARPGDRLSIEFAPRSSSSPNERRDVEVTLTDERYVYVTSGKTRPGHPTGGNLSADEQGEVWYQPTLMQAPRRVVALSLCKVLPLTRAA